MTNMKFDMDKIKAYSSLKHRLYFLGLAFSLGILLIFILSGLNADLRNLVFNISINFYLNLIIFYLTFSFAFFILGLPLDYHDGYTIEKRFDLSTQNKKEWMLDTLKKFAVSLIIGLILISALYYLLRNFSNIWWILAAIFYFLFSVLMAKVMPVVILPLFYKQKPLERQELKSRLLKLAKKTGQNIKDVFEIDLSRETKKANAALVGSGSTRRILLADTLLEKYTDEEIKHLRSTNARKIRALSEEEKIKYYKKLNSKSQKTKITIVKYGIYPPEENGKIKWINQKYVGKDIESIRHLFPVKVDEIDESPFSLIDVK